MPVPWLLVGVGEQWKTAMVNDMQPFLNGLSRATNPAISERRERRADFQPLSSESRFDTMLETAQARRAGSGHEAMSTKPRNAEQRIPAVHAEKHSHTERPLRTAAQDRQEESAVQAERTRSDKADDSEEGRDEQDCKACEQSQPSGSLSPEMILAGSLVPQPLMENKLTVQTPSSSTETESDAAAKAGNDVQSVTIPGIASREVQSTIPTQVGPIVQIDQTPRQMSADPQADSTGTQPAGSDKVSRTSHEKDGNRDVAPVAAIPNQDAFGTTVAALNEEVSVEVHADTDKSRAALTLMALHATGKQVPTVDGGDQRAGQSPVDYVVPMNAATTDQTAWGSEQHVGEDSHSSSDSRGGPERPKADLLPSEETTLRPQFLDPVTGTSPSGPSAGENRIGRTEGGASAVAHLRESDRLNELRESSSFTQSVTVDLDPLDMGPLRVRVMMTEQTVHAHIRTEHEALGQGLLQQGQSLESSLRTTGLEMGMLRVTVDQQQQGRGEQAWAFQQQQGRPGAANGPASRPTEDQRDSRADHGVYSNGRVSYFA
jgi:hypothetical protein